MSGHSKWSSIKHKKGAADAKRGKLFSKLSRAIIVAAKEGGPDPAGNLALQNAIEKARSYSMPKDNIERAIARGSGADSDAQAFETVVYEGYGPNGVAVIVEALTDNRNRTASDVRACVRQKRRQPRDLRRSRLALRAPRRGVVAADGVDEDELTLAAAEGGADDVELDGSTYQVTSAPEALTAVREAVEAAGIHRRFRGVDDGAEDDGRGRRRILGEEDRAADGGAGGQRRRPGRLRELRHPGARPRDRRFVGTCSRDSPWHVSAKAVLVTPVTHGATPVSAAWLSLRSSNGGSRGSRVLPRRFSRPNRAGVRRDRVRDASRVPADPRARPLHRCGVVLL